MGQKKSFTFEIDESSDVPLWAQLRQRLVYLIDSGYFQPGDQLPTVRGLASEISINYNTVNKAYLSLVSDGFLESTRGRGVFVRGIAADAGDDASMPEADVIVDDCITACRGLGMSLDDVRRCMLGRIQHAKNAEGGDAAQQGGARIVKVDVNAPAPAGVRGA